MSTACLQTFIKQVISTFFWHQFLKETDFFFQPVFNKDSVLLRQSLFCGVTKTALISHYLMRRKTEGLEENPHRSTHKVSI